MGIALPIRMNKVLKIIAMISLFSLRLSAAGDAGAGSGGSCGGGGTTVSFQNKRILLDLLRIPEAKRVQDRDQFEIKSEAKVIKKLILDSSSNTSTLIQSDIMILAKRMIDDWGTNGGFAIMAAEASLGFFAPVGWLLAAPSENLPFKPADLTDFRQLNLKDADLVAFYVREEHKYEISIVPSEWNQLAVLSQVGTLVHEGLRHLQFMNVTSGAVLTDFDDVKLQRATAIILLCKPRPILNQLINLILLGEKIDPTSEFADADRLLKETCISKISNDGKIEMGGAFK